MGEVVRNEEGRNLFRPKPFNPKSFKRQLSGGPLRSKEISAATPTVIPKAEADMNISFHQQRRKSLYAINEEKHKLTKEMK